MKKNTLEVLLLLDFQVTQKCIYRTQLAWQCFLLVETFRFEDENDYEYEIWLEVFSRILKI